MDTEKERQAFLDLLPYYSLPVQTAVADWNFIHNQDVKRYYEHERDGNNHGDNNKEDEERELEEMLNNDNHVLSDNQIRQRLERLDHDFFVNFNNWSSEDMSYFMKFVYPLKLFQTILHNRADQPEVFKHVFHTWQPNLFEWIKFFWYYTEGACELFADALFCLPDEQKVFVSSTIKNQIHEHDNDEEEEAMEFTQELSLIMYVYLLQSVDNFNELSLIPITKTIIPYARVPSCAIKHADMIIQMSKYLNPYEIGLIVRCLIFGLAQPFTCTCGYKTNETYCVCVVVDNKNRYRDRSRERKAVISLDSGRVYACILLRILLKQFLSPNLRNYNKQWTDSMRDQLIVSSCEYVFTSSTFATIYKTIVQGVQKNDIPVVQKHPRPDIDSEFRNTEEDFDNSQAQTGSCVVANCKQTAKLDCANVSCATHCSNFRFSCRVHRTYPEDQPYRPRLKVEYYIGGGRVPITRDSNEI